TAKPQTRRGQIQAPSPRPLQAFSPPRLHRPRRWRDPRPDESPRSPSISIMASCASSGYRMAGPSIRAIMVRESRRINRDDHQTIQLCRRRHAERIVIALFLLGVAFCAYTLFGYPLLLGLLARRRARPVRKAAWPATVSVILPVYN